MNNNIFLGLPIPPGAIELLKNLLIQEHPHWEHHSAIRWTGEHHHHLTMHFFGLVPVEIVNPLIPAFDEQFHLFRKFSLKINKIDNFPKEKSRLIAAFIQLSPVLAKLYAEIQKVVERHQLPVEKRTFLPHITVCRSHRNRVLHGNPIVLPDHLIEVTQIILYQTQSTAKGNEYLPLKTWQLNR